MSIAIVQTYWGRLKDWFFTLSPAERLYLAGMADTAGTILLALVGADHVYVGLMFSFAMLFCATGVLLEAYRKVVAGLSSPLMKAALTLSTMVAAAVAAGTSAVLIGTATQQDPNHFKWALPILAPFSFIPVLGLLVTVIAGASLLPMMMFLMSRAKSVGFSSWLGLARVLGVLGVFSGAIWLISTPTNARLADAARYVVYWFDMHVDTTCSPVEGDRVVRLNESLVIIGRLTSDGPKFLRKPCALAEESAELPRSIAGR